MKVLIVCSGGMSSAIVVKAIEKEAARQDIKITVKAVGTGEVEDELKNGWGLLLVAPQVRHRLDELKAKAGTCEIPVALIPPQGYTPFGGAMVLDEILKHMV
ncbi:MAG: phosphotransferase system lactose/cellobiose-specific subunit [Firmicutes bacterium]|nr:phosphotransferase system lactose/cellobiose-specific subunit [Bacillota bacterium]